MLDALQRDAEGIERMNRGFVVVDCLGRCCRGQDGTQLVGCAAGIKFDYGGGACGGGDGDAAGGGLGPGGWRFIGEREHS